MKQCCALVVVALALTSVRVPQEAMAMDFEYAHKWPSFWTSREDSSGSVFIPASGQLALEEACRTGDLVMVRSLLLYHRVDPTHNANRALRIAVDRGHLAVVEYLLGFGVDPSDAGNAAIRTASARGHVAVVQRLLADARVDPTASQHAALRLAAEQGRADVVHVLLQDGRVDPRAENQYAIRMAAFHGHVQVVERLLVDVRVNPAADKNYAIRYAAQNGHLQVMERLLADPRVDPSATMNQALRWACYHGHVAVVRRLLQEERVDPAAMHYHAIRGSLRFQHWQVLQALLESPRVDLNAAVPVLLGSSEGWLRVLALPIRRNLNMTRYGPDVLRTHHRNSKMMKALVHRLAREHCVVDRHLEESSFVCRQFSAWIAQQIPLLERLTGRPPPPSREEASKLVEWIRRWIALQWNRLTRIVGGTMSLRWLHRLYQPDSGLLFPKTRQRWLEKVGSSEWLHNPRHSTKL